MSEPTLKSYAFRKEREDSWEQLQDLLAKAESKGIQALTPQEALDLPRLYRTAVSSLSVARSISLDRELILYLESLSARAYFFVYGTRDTFSGYVTRFFTHDWPAAVSGARGLFLLATVVFFAGFAAGFGLTLNDMEWFHAFVPGDLTDTRTPTATTEHLRETLFDTEADEQKDLLTIFASFLFTHNARIGMMAFALGFAFGIPTLILLFHNGMAIGAFVALFWSRGLGTEVIGWLSIHGTTEILAILLSATAGLVIGRALAFPDRYGRLDSLAEHGPRAARIVIGAVLMFFIAGLLEGYGRQLIVDTGTRYAIGLVMLGFWIAYLFRPGRRP